MQKQRAEIYYVAISDSEKVQISKAGYNFSTPMKKWNWENTCMKFPVWLIYPGKNMILAENDEKGEFLHWTLKIKMIMIGKIKFGGKGDYEDIVYTDTAIYMLVSTGAVVQVKTRDSSFTTKEFILEGREE